LVARPGATVRLLCFPYAGAGATVFGEIARACPDWISLHGVEYPGRAWRQREAALDSVAGLAEAVTPALAGLLDVPFAALGPPLHPLPDDAFIETTASRYGGIPAEVLSDPELIALFLPTLRADTRASETYEYRDAPALSCPIQVFGGLHDPTTSMSGLEAWREQTRAGSAVQRFQAGHFFLRPHGVEMAATIARVLADAAQRSCISLK
jgi:surfactin synthase thioesterase subunit